MSNRQTISEYGFISSKIALLKKDSPLLREKTDATVFSALFVKSLFYKNPAYVLNDSDLDEIIVDGPYDGGVDILLTDPASEDSDIILGQSKFYEESIKEQEILDAFMKMWLFYQDMNSGHYEQYSEIVQRRFLTLLSEASENAKIHFIVFTSAPKKRISVDRIKKKFADQLSESCPNFEIDLYFGTDIIDEIKEAESRRACVESCSLSIDRSNNYLSYREYGNDNTDDDAIIVNVSALCIKRLYALHSNTLLSKNLRYFIKSKDIDKGINTTINNSPSSFWFRNNGITVICDDFIVDGKEVKLTNFSIINGGQTTFLLYRSARIDDNNDFFLPCKIIRLQGENEQEKGEFSLEIAKATNSQKPIKKLDLKANAPEQLRFAQELRDIGIYYLTKRGEEVPKDYREKYKNADLLKIGKLCLCGIFQRPCSSRNKPSLMYEDKYYNPVFKGNQHQLATMCKELLYIDYYFQNHYIKKFDRANENEPDKGIRIPFAHNARTICIAFVAFAARYNNGNITDSDISTVEKASRPNSEEDILYDVCCELGEMKGLFSVEIFDNKDKLETIICKLFDAIIDEGIRCYTSAFRYDSGITATNFLKKDKNYYIILNDYWRELRRKIKDTFASQDS